MPRPAVNALPFLPPMAGGSAALARLGPAGSMENTFYFGDNLDIMRRHLPAKSVDLVYADPPFQSDQNYNVLFQERDGAGGVADSRL